LWLQGKQSRASTPALPGSFLAKSRMRARLITALALGCCLPILLARPLGPLGAGLARADDFDDDFGSLPPAAPKPAQALPPVVAPAAPTPAPSPTSPPAAIGGRSTARDEIADPWYSSYPPLDEDDPRPTRPQADARRYAFVHPTVDGPIGGVHVVDADSAWRGSFRVGINGGFFRKDGFLLRGDRARQGSASLNLTLTPIDHLELAASVSTVSTESRDGEPRLVQAVGDVRLFAKGFARVQPWLTAGGDVELGLLNGVGSFGIREGAANVGLRANLSADLRELPGHALPLILRSNLRYLFDNSGKLVRGIEADRYDSLSSPSPRASEYRSLVTPGERFALGVNRVDQLAFSFGAELPFRPHQRVHVDPLLEWSVALPINRQGFDCLATSIAGQRDGCLDKSGFSSRASTMTFGLRVQPYVSGLGLLLAVDVATSGAREFVRELAPQSRYMLRFALSYAYDPHSLPPPRTRVQRIEIPAGSLRGHIVGQVVEAQTGTPLPNAIVHFEATSLSDVVSDETGGFRSAELGPGAQGMRVRAEGYREALCVAVVTSQGSDVNARCELTPSAYYGALQGHVTDNAGNALGNARITLHGPSELLLAGDAAGAFTVPKLVEGEYELAVAADGYFPRTTRLTVARDVVSTPVLGLIPRADRSLVRIVGKRLALQRQVAFTPDSAILLPEGEPLLAEVAELLQKHPELKLVEIQGHGEDVPVPPGAAPLTQQRAEAVRDWLVNTGVDGARLNARGYGPTRPLAPNITLQNRARNRRIEFVLQ
jgi:OmpA-OmpF porin, OOP family